MARSAGGGVRFTVSGVKEIQRAYRLLPKQVANKVVRQAVRKSLKPMLEAAKREAPVSDPSVKYSAPGRDSHGRFTAATTTSASDHTPGQLRRAIKLRARVKRKRGIIALDVRVGDGDFKGATFYAAMVNYGTKYQEGQHYMEAAFDASKDASSRTVIQLIGAGITREWKNL